MLGANQRIINIEAARKKEEYQNNKELVEISRLCETQQVHFKIEVARGLSPKAVALETAQNLNATWVILDRQMKKDRKYFLEKLSCGISRMKHNQTIEQLRGPKVTKNSILPKEIESNIQVAYDEMVPGYPDEDDLFSIDIFPKSQTEANRLSLDQEQAQGSCQKDRLDGQSGDWETPMCSICKHRWPLIGWNRDFTYEELKAATEGFSVKNSLSDLTFQGQIGTSKLKIVVKKQKSISFDQGKKELKSLVQSLIKARHKNVAMMLGSSTEENHPLIVYEYVCSGSLDKYLSKGESSRSLTWTERVKVAIGASRGLRYLHENNIIHGDVKPSNILLTHDFEPLLVDFGFHREKHDFEQSPRDKNVGDFGYLAPEYLESGKLSTETDVYSFGMVLLELISGQRIKEKMSREKSLLEWAKPLLEERKYQELVDPKISSSCDVHQLLWLVRVTEQCLNKNPEKRLAINLVVSILECITENQSCCVTEDSSLAKSNLTRSVSTISGSQSIKGTPEQDHLSTNLNQKISQKDLALQLKSSTSSSTNVGKIPSNSGRGRKMEGTKSRRQGQILYMEMLS
ncbi:putative Serine-threonine protein kinase [Quillaja saponaria]|uniref:Serine-threonine protein kinase n=1 Tax=Quillaja saponaria TaxID=32244 RepID=A0AAD7LM73_QUISA|nr:putative Serine-threonine protein kinase [Quillaja saponaria]